MYVVGGKIAGSIGGWPKRNSQPLLTALPAKVRFETVTGLHVRRRALRFGVNTGQPRKRLGLTEFGRKRLNGFRRSKSASRRLSAVVPA
jgi:hypothetical protein